MLYLFFFKWWKKSRRMCLFWLGFMCDSLKLFGVILCGIFCLISSLKKITFLYFFVVLSHCWWNFECVCVCAVVVSLFWPHDDGQSLWFSCSLIIFSPSSFYVFPKSHSQAWTVETFNLVYEKDCVGVLNVTSCSFLAYQLKYKK